MKRFFTGIFAIFLLAGCRTAAINNAAPAAPQKTLKVGYYIGDGSSGNGVYWLARLLAYSPQIKMTLLDGRDIQNGALDQTDLLVIPGGDSWRQSDDIGKKGKEIIRNFVKNGGAYWGVCAGFHCALDKPDRLGLVPYKWIDGVRGSRAKLAIDINDAGAKILDIKGGRYFATYSHGPISREINEWEHGRVQTLAIYKSTVSEIGRKSNFMNSPALIYGNYGKGKVIATSFHPEVHRENDVISMGCIYAVTGVKPTPVYPVKNYRPVRVAYLTSYTAGKEPIVELLKLDQEKDLDVRFLSSNELSDGLLLNTDVVIIHDSNAKARKNTINQYRKDFENFLERNGRIIAGEKMREYLPSHKNVKIIPSGQSFTREALRKP